MMSGEFLDGFEKFCQSFKPVKELRGSSSEEWFEELTLGKFEFLTPAEKQLFAEARAYYEEQLGLWGGMREGKEYIQLENGTIIFNGLICDADVQYPGFILLIEKCLKKAINQHHQERQHIFAHLS